MLATCEIAEDVGVVTIDNPPVNAVAPGVPSAIITAATQLIKSDRVSAILLRGANGTFIAGADISRIGQPWPVDEPTFSDLCRFLDDTPKPVIAAMEKFALGGGSEIALSCNYRVATASTRVGQPEVLLGFPPGAGATQRLPRLVGLEHALDIIVSGCHLSAAEAKAIGYIDEIVEEGQLLEEAIRFAQKVALPGKTHPRCRDRPAPSVPEGAFKAARKRYRGREAPLLCIDCIELSTRLPFDEGLREEFAIFKEAREALESKALRHVFLSEREARKLPDAASGGARRALDRVAVVGGGLMGTGIAMCFADRAMDVTIVEASEEAGARARDRIKVRYRKDVEKALLSVAAANEISARIQVTTSRQILSDADLVIEAVFENRDLKAEIFRELSEVAKPGCIAATNTSYLDVKKLARAFGRPADFVGLHFFSPAHVTRLLEVVDVGETGNDVLATAMGLAGKLGKVPVLAGTCEGFIANRMFSRYTCAAIVAVVEGARPAQVDAALRAFGFPMGPLEVLDMAGLEIGWARRKAKGLANRLSPETLANRLCELGRYGQKSGRGFYLYEPGDRTPREDPDLLRLAEDLAVELGVTRRAVNDEVLAEICLAALAEEGRRIVDEGMATRESDIDVVWINGFGFPRHKGGPMFWARYGNGLHDYPKLDGASE